MKLYTPQMIEERRTNEDCYIRTLSSDNTALHRDDRFIGGGKFQRRHADEKVITNIEKNINNCFFTYNNNLIWCGGVTPWIQKFLCFYVPLRGGNNTNVLGLLSLEK